MATRTEWRGTATELLGALAEIAGEREAKAKTWPASARAIGGRLRRAATFLRKIGIEIAHYFEGRARTRMICITVASADPAQERGGVQPSAPSASSAPVPNPNPVNGFAAPDLRTVANDADGPPNRTVETVRANTLKSKGENAADGADAKDQPQSAPGKTGWSARL
jgi:hypothetical protein